MGLQSRNAKLVALVALALAIRVGYCAYRGSLGVSPPVGYREYVIIGQNLLDTGTITTPLVRQGGGDTPSFIMPPAYTALVACVYGLFGVETTAATLVLQLLNALATTIAVLVVYDLARRIAGEGAGLIAGFATAIHPALFAYTDMIWDTSLYTLAVIVTVWLAWRLGDRKRGGATYVFFGLWLGAVAMLNPSLTITYPLLVLWPILRSGVKGASQWVRPVGLAMLGWVIALTPWTARNYIHFSELIYVRGGFWVEMWLGVCPEADTNGADVFKNHFPLSNPRIESHVRAVGERQWVAECKQQAKTAIAHNPARWGKLILMRTIDYWTGTAFGHRIAGGSFLPQSRNRLLTMVFYLVELGFIIGFAFTRRFHGQRLDWRGNCAVLAYLLVSFSIVYCLSHVQVRFRAPMEPVAMVLLGVLAVRRLTRIWQPTEQSRRDLLPPLRNAEFRIEHHV